MMSPFSEICAQNGDLMRFSGAHKSCMQSRLCPLIAHFFLPTRFSDFDLLSSRAIVGARGTTAKCPTAIEYQSR